MLRVRVIAAATCLGIALAAMAFADQWDKKTILTTGQSIQVPGKVLPPGKYVMKLFNSLGNRNIVQIFNENETEILATILAIPNYRLKPADETHFSYWETSIGKPVPLKGWFYPGDNFGQEFAYPKEAATEIARETSEPVPVIHTEKPAELPTAELGLVEPSGQERPIFKTWEPQARREPPMPAPKVDPAPVAQQPAPEPARLPETASFLPLLSLLGFSSLSAGLALKMMAKRR
jgi:hypothetical protein